MSDLQQAVERLRVFDETNHPDCWSLIGQTDSDPQMLRDVITVARAYIRKETVVHRMLERVVMEMEEEE